MISLQKGAVRVVPHRPGWHDLFEQERLLLRRHLGHLALDVQHMGSSAVPGLDAEPIIDIAVAVASAPDILRCVSPLCRLGYVDRKDEFVRGVLGQQAGPR